MKPSDFKILVADDSMLARKKLRNCLAGLDYTNVIEAVDGENAVELFQSENPLLVFMDIVMPKKYGIDALKEIKAINEDAVVVMVSSTGTKVNVADAIKAGANDFLTKPFTVKQVYEVLEHFNK